MQSNELRLDGIRANALARRQMLGWGATALLGAALPACSERRSPVAAGSAAPAYTSRPSSTPDPVAPVERCALTEDNILGPYYLPGAPERTDLRQAGMDGTPLEVVGTVRSVDCRPLAHAQLEIWQADHRGAYDVTGPTLRALLRTDDEGRYRVSTILPGRYLNGAQYRPAHVHFRVVAPRHRALVTQLYFAGDPYNDVDPFVRPSLVVPLQTAGANQLARFDIVLATVG